jgi:hypothetical protein
VRKSRFENMSVRRRRLSSFMKCVLLIRKIIANFLHKIVY